MLIQWWTAFNRLGRDLFGSRAGNEDLVSYFFRNVQFYPTSSPMVASILKPAQAGFCVLQAPF